MEELQLPSPMTIRRFRRLYPQYNELSDYDVTRIVHLADAPDVPFEQFAPKFGGPLEEDANIVQARDYNAKHPDDPIRPEDIGQGSYAEDIGHSFAAGINEMAAVPLWLMQQGTEAVGLDGLSRLFGQGGKYFSDSAEEKRRGLSADAKLSNEKKFITEDAEGNYTGFGDAWSDPRRIAMGIAGSAPGTVAGMMTGAGIAGWLMKAGVASRPLAYAIGGFIGEGGVAGSQNAMDVHTVIMQMPDETLQRSPEYMSMLEAGNRGRRPRNHADTQLIPAQSQGAVHEGGT
jgi:hypothetical protein